MITVLEMFPFGLVQMSTGRDFKKERSKSFCFKESSSISDFKYNTDHLVNLLVRIVSLLVAFVLILPNPRLDPYSKLKTA